jgi:hypothetical protein
MNEPQLIFYKGKNYWGYKKCPAWLKAQLIKSRDCKCEECGTDKNLEIHRIKRGVEGGLYVVCERNHPLHNTKVLCHTCHEKYNYSRRLNYSL